MKKKGNKTCNISLNRKLKDAKRNKYINMIIIQRLNYL